MGIYKYPYSNKTFHDEYTGPFQIVFSLYIFLSSQRAVQDIYRYYEPSENDGSVAISQSMRFSWPVYL